MRTYQPSQMLCPLARLAQTALIVITGVTASFATGVPDVTFGNAGSARVAVPSHTTISDVVFAADGRMIVVAPNDQGTTSFVRLSQNGAADNTVSTGILSSMSSTGVRITDALLQPDG